MADILNHHCDFDIVIMFKRKHLNGVSISTYGTLGLGEAFVSGEGVMGTTFKDMFEAFCEEYGKKSDVASEVRAPPLNDDRFDHPASQPRVGECAHVEGTTSHAPSTANNVPDSLDRQARGSTTEGTTSQPLSHGSGLPDETSVGSPRPTVVFYRENTKNVAVGYLCPQRHTLHGKPVPQGFDVVQVTWVANQEGGVAAPIVLGDEEENSQLSPGHFFALPRAQLVKIIVVDRGNQAASTATTSLTLC
ncbi:uncharacterized protein [Pocillopora verrucosa]|uniref:uncharacterized protein n=1 Tax=Pocillopora verrucosa TaxID=203993 RepID=UPI0033414A1B